MKILSLVAAAILMPAAALAQSGSQATAPCQQRIDEVAANLPDLTGNPDAHEELGVTREHLQAALAALDAARLARMAGAEQGCLTMANAAEAMLTEGGFEPAAEAPAD